MYTISYVSPLGTDHQGVVSGRPCDQSSVQPHQELWTSNLDNTSD